MRLLMPILIIGCSLAACNNSGQQPAAGATTPVTSSVKINGEQLFKIKCMQCHMPAKDFAAPALAGVEERWDDKKTLYAFVRNSQEVIQRNAYAKALFEKWKQAPMLPFPELSNGEIDAIFEYCNKYAS